MTVTAVNGASAPTTTYQDGPGNPNQGSMVWAASSFTWWYFQINSANDATGNPGTHKVSAWYNSYSSCAGDPGAGAWVYYGDSPNLDSSGGRATNANCLFRNGRSLGAVYWNNASGSNKDLCHVAAGIYPASGVPNDANAFIGNLRVILASSSVTWGTWGYYVCNTFNYANSSVQAAFAMGRGTDGRVHLGCAILTDQLDAAAIASFDVDTADSWTTGGRGTGTVVGGGSTVTAMSNQTGLAAGYGLKNDLLGEGGGPSTNKVNSIDSGTQVTVRTVWGGAGTNTGAAVGWTNFTPGTRANLITDSSMTNECNCFGFAALASGNMLMVYDAGNLAAPNFNQLSSIKGSGTIAAGFWPNAGGPDASVFAATNTQLNNDWSLCSVSTSAIYCARRTAATTCEVRSYATATNNWAALTNAPPTMTSKTIVAGGGVCLVSDGTDMWLLVIDSTDAQIKYTKYTHGGTNTNGTWGSWTNLASVGATAAFLTAVIANGYLCASWTEKNANNTNYDTKVASLSVGSHSAGPPAAPNKTFAFLQSVNTAAYH